MSIARVCTRYALPSTAHPYTNLSPNPDTHTHRRAVPTLTKTILDTRAAMSMPALVRAADALANKEVNSGCRGHSCVQMLRDLSPT